MRHLICFVRFSVATILSTLLFLALMVYEYGDFIIPYIYNIPGSRYSYTVSKTEYGHSIERYDIDEKFGFVFVDSNVRLISQNCSQLVGTRITPTDLSDDITKFWQQPNGYFLLNKENSELHVGLTKNELVELLKAKKIDLSPDTDNTSSTTDRRKIFSKCNKLLKGKKTE